MFSARRRRGGSAGCPRWLTRLVHRPGWEGHPAGRPCGSAGL